MTSSEFGKLDANTGTDGRKLSTYGTFLQDSGIRVVRASAVPSLLDLELTADVNDTSAAYVQLDGMQGLSSLEVLEIPSGYDTGVQRHLYEEYVLALSGTGVVAFIGESGETRECTWSRESVFAIPLNMRFRIRNDSPGPARLVLINNAHLMMDLLGSSYSVFNCDLAFPEREELILDRSRTAELIPRGRRMSFNGPVFNDLGTAPLPKHEFIRGPGFGYLLLNLAGGVFGSHVGELPEGHISNAHWHMGGAILIAVAGEGYTLSWPSGAGPQPPPSEIHRDDFGYSGVVSVGIGWFHLHANTGFGPLRQVAFRYGGGAGATFSTVQGVEYAPGRVVDVTDLNDTILSEYRAEISRRGIPIVT